MQEKNVKQDEREERSEKHFSKKGKGNHHKSKGYGGNRRKAERAEKFEKSAVGKDEFVDKTNDPAWYVGVPGVADAGANFNFLVPKGDKISYPNTERLTANFGAKVDTTLPGVMAFQVINVPGMDDNLVKSAMWNIYTYVRHENSGHSNYAAPDLMMYLMRVDSVYSLYACACRAYGLLRAYEMFNRENPRVFFTAMGLDYDKWSKDAASVRMRLNVLAARINTFAVPSNLPIFQRHAFMYSNVYRDSESVKSQFYLFNPAVYWAYNVGDASTGPYLEAKSFYGQSSTTWELSPDDFLGILEHEVNLLSEDGASNIMSGDILKAYKGALASVAPIAVDYATIPVYSREMLNQIRNINLWDIVGSSQAPYVFKSALDSCFSYDISLAEQPGIWINGKFQLSLRQYVTDGGSRANAIVSAGERVLVLDDDMCSVAGTLVGSRLMTAQRILNDPASPQLGHEWWTEVHHCGTEVCVACNIFYYQPAASTSIPVPYHISPRWNLGGGTSIILTSVKSMCALSKFSYHPNLMVPGSFNSASTKFTLQADYHDYDNYAVLEEPEVGRLHAIALASLWNINL